MFLKRAKDCSGMMVHQSKNFVNLPEISEERLRLESWEFKDSFSIFSFSGTYNTCSFSSMKNKEDHLILFWLANSITFFFYLYLACLIYFYLTVKTVIAQTLQMFSKRNKYKETRLLGRVAMENELFGLISTENLSVCGYFS